MNLFVFEPDLTFLNISLPRNRTTEMLRNVAVASRACGQCEIIRH